MPGGRAQPRKCSVGVCGRSLTAPASPALPAAKASVAPKKKFVFSRKAPAEPSAKPPGRTPASPLRWRLARFRMVRGWAGAVGPWRQVPPAGAPAPAPVAPRPPAGLDMGPPSHDARISGRVGGLVEVDQG